jgi:MFS family permease
VFTLDNLYVILALYSVPALLSNLYTGPTFGMTQSLAPLAMRAAASALLLFIINIIGLVFGPTTVGILSDLFQSMWQMNDVESLQTALLICSFVYLISFVNYYLAGKHLPADLARAQAAH